MSFAKITHLQGVGVRPLVTDANGVPQAQDAATFRTTIGAQSVGNYPITVGSFSGSDTVLSSTSFTLFGEIVINPGDYSQYSTLEFNAFGGTYTAGPGIEAEVRLVRGAESRVYASIPSESPMGFSASIMCNRVSGAGNFSVPVGEFRSRTASAVIYDPQGVNAADVAKFQLWLRLTSAGTEYPRVGGRLVAY